MMRNLPTILCLLFVAAAVTVREPRAAEAAAADKKAERKGPLKDLPSEPGPHLAKIKALGENEWLDLGSPEADPEWGKARGRTWSPRAAYAPELRGAFVTGEGVHGFTKPDGHYMDDLWFYDANAHRWVCVYPGFKLDEYDKVEFNEDGFESVDGQPIPIAQSVHAYSTVSYDTKRGRFMVSPRHHGGYWEKVIEGRREVMTKEKLRQYGRQASPWMYDTAEGRYMRFKTEAQAPARNTGGQFLYVPSVDKSFFFWRMRAEGAHWYDNEKNDWSSIEDKGDLPAFGYSPVGCYDSKRDRIYLGGGTGPAAEPGDSLRIFDVKTETWINPKPKGRPATPDYNNALGIMHYDRAADAVILFIQRTTKTGDPRGVYAYDPEKNEWTTLQEGAKGSLTAKTAGRTCFYDPELNVHFLHTAGDSKDNGTMWAYRYKKSGDE